MLVGKQMTKEEQFELISDEIKVLYSIFCGEDEFFINGSPPDDYVDALCHDLLEDKIRHVHLSIKVSCAENIKIQLSLSLSKHYPYTIPEISVSSLELTRKNLEKVHEKLVDYARSLNQCPEPVVLKLNNWLQDNVSQLCSAVKTEAEHGNRELFSNDKRTFIAILRFDHMRSRKKYLKTISKWMKELNLNGCVLFFTKEIFVIMEGWKFNISEYLKRQRTITVDVDSSGRACKERLMEVVCEIEKTEQHWYVQFNIYDVIYLFY